MGSLENGISLKRAGSRNERHPFSSRPRSRFSRLLLFKKLDYLQWICTVAVFLFFVVFFQMFLPGSVMDKSQGSFLDDKDSVFGELSYLKEMGALDFGEDIRLEPCKLLEKFQRENKLVNLDSSSGFNRSQHRFHYRKPQLALVFADLLVHPQQLLMVTIATALKEIGYELQVYSLEDGLARNAWQSVGVPVTILKVERNEIAVDWLNFIQEPFKSIPLIWTIHERALAIRSREYTSSGQIELVNDWKKVFCRATVVVFPNYALPMIYSTFDSGNYYVIPGSPAVVWKGENAMNLLKDSQRIKMGYGPDEVLIAIVGSQFMYKGLWLEHALILQALLPLFADNNSNSHPKIIILSNDSTSNYSMAVERIALNLRYPSGVVKHVAVEEEVDNVLSMTDIVIYGSFLDEPSFPEVLTKAMSLGKPIIAPELSNIRKYASLSGIAETSLLDAIEKQKNGDALYFWVRMDTDPRNNMQRDFWSFCDAINAGKCKLAFSETLKRMYGLGQDFNSLPPMPEGEGTWSVMQSWALPTKSFLEFVMFSRMFVDALDAQMYDEHYQSGHCYLSFSKDKHCYSRVLELLINVWAYHSARRIVYVNPETGAMQEYHKFKDRSGKMWIKWFSFNTLKVMDEDLAEEADSDHLKRRWLWPSTGEVVWQGILDRERNLRNRQKETRKQKSKDKLERMRHKHRQKALGRYVKPLPEDIEISNSTTVTSV